jgi:peroxiredoxin Q/BCP
MDVMSDRTVSDRAKQGQYLNREGAAMASQPNIGDRLEFSLPGFRTGRSGSSSFAGSRMLCCIYPRDNTPGCTQEACDFATVPQLKKGDTVVLGISPDSTASHEKFAAKFGLPFFLLSDPEHQVAEEYGVWVERNMYGRKSMGIQRATFLIDKKGKIAAVWPKVKVKGHVAVLAPLKEL